MTTLTSISRKSIKVTKISRTYLNSPAKTMSYTIESWSNIFNLETPNTLAQSLTGFELGEKINYSTTGPIML